MLNIALDCCGGPTTAHESRVADTIGLFFLDLIAWVKVQTCGTKIVLSNY